MNKLQIKTTVFPLYTEHSPDVLSSTTKLVRGLNVAKKCFVNLTKIFHTFIACIVFWRVPIIADLSLFSSALSQMSHFNLALLFLQPLKPTVFLSLDNTFRLNLIYLCTFILKGGCFADKIELTSHSFKM